LTYAPADTAEIDQLNLYSYKLAKASFNP
jgi:hypothetical protein